MDLLKETYDRIKEDPDTDLQLEPPEIIKAVDEHRRFWKPEKVKTLLLAESHVFTKIEDYKSLDYSKLDPNDESCLKYCPKSMVRFVYCLGYGENGLIEGKITKNSGTWQFWKIFVACTSEDKKFENFEFSKILKSKTKNLQKRIKNKLEVLKKLREKGIWLLDASIVGLYNNKSNSKKEKSTSNKPTPKTIGNIIEICWGNYISKVIETEKPKFMIIIGKGVEKRLKDCITKNTPKGGSIQVRGLKIPCEIIPQPQARLTKEEIKSNFERYQKLCNQ